MGVSAAIENLPASAIETAAQVVLSPLKENPPSNVIVDLSRVQFFTSEFISFLLRCHVIVKKHHGYVRQSLPLIQEHLAKVVAAHGSRHSELAVIESQFSKVADELLLHLVKEEQVLFPYIELLADAVHRNGPHPPDMFGTVQNPIRMMEIEHEEACDGMMAIRQLSRRRRVQPKHEPKQEGGYAARAHGL